MRSFLYNSGAYRPVDTQKIDFLTFEDVEMSRTRLIDDNMGYAWDRIVAYLKREEIFLVIDAVQSKISDVFTYANLWHTRQVHASGPNYFVTRIDSIRSNAFPDSDQLLIAFLETEAKEIGSFEEDRHFQRETALYQTQSSHYQAGSYELFVTALIPTQGEAEPADWLDRLTLLPVSMHPRALGIRIDSQDATSYLCVKIDLESELVRENIRPRYAWEAGRTEYGPVVTDAHFAFLTVEGTQVRFAASEFLKVQYEGQTLIEALPNTHGLQLDGSPPKIGYTKWRSWEETLDLILVNQ